MINLYYNLQFVKDRALHHLITIDIISDTGQEFHGEISDYKCKNITQNVKNTIIQNLMYTSLITDELYSHIHLPNRHTYIYNGSVADLKNYPNIDNLHIIGKLSEVTNVLNYWMAQFKTLNNNDIKYIGNNISRDYLILNSLLSTFIQPKAYDNYLDIYGYLHACDLTSRISQRRYTNNVIPGADYNGIYEVKLIQELYHRLRSHGNC